MTGYTPTQAEQLEYELYASASNFYRAINQAIAIAPTHRHAALKMHMDMVKDFLAQDWVYEAANPLVSVAAEIVQHAQSHRAKAVQ